MVDLGPMFASWPLHRLVFAATGRLAFGGDSVMAVMMRIMNEAPDVTGVSDSLRSVIMECLEKDPARRPKARDIMLRLVDPSAPYPQQTLLTPAGPGPTARQTGPAGPAFPVDSVPFADRPTHLGSPAGLAPDARTAAPAAFDPRTGPVPELPGSIQPDQCQHQVGKGSIIQGERSPSTN